MFRKFAVENFMCLKDVAVELEPLTIFAGPNSAGKSAFFKALTTFSKLLWYPVRGGPSGDFNVEAGVTLDNAVWKGDSSLPIRFSVWFDNTDGEEPDYAMELRRDYAGWSVTRERFAFQGHRLDTGSQRFEMDTARGHVSWPGPYKASLLYLTGNRYIVQDQVAGQHVKPIQELRACLGQARRYRPSASDIASYVKEAEDKERTVQHEVDESGRGLALVLRDMLTTNRESFSEIEQQLHSLHDHVTGMTFRREWRGIGLYYKTNRTDQDTPASLESDGVLLSTFLLWRVYAGTPNLKLCLEEPENGVHLSGLGNRYQLLKSFATEVTTRPTPQILVATHSRDFLNVVPRHSALKEFRVVEFGSPHGTEIHTLTHWRDINRLLDEFKGQLGDLWWSGRLQHRDTQ